MKSPAVKGSQADRIKAKVMLAAMKMEQQQRRNQRHEHLYNKQHRLQRRCEQRRARLERETPVHRLLSVITAIQIL